MLLNKTLSTNFFAILGLVLASATFSYGQTKEKISVKPTDGELSPTIRSKGYYYPEFKKGKVVFISDVTSSAVLNYNMLTEEVEFINSKKDTLALDNMYTVKMIVIGTDTFYYDAGSSNILKLVDQIGNSKILVKERYALSNVKNVGAMGIESSTTSPTSTTNTDHRGNQNSLKQNESLIYSAKTSFYLSNRDEFVPATKANLLKLYPSHADKLKDYMKENKVDMKTEEEIKKLLQYASSL